MNFLNFNKFSRVFPVNKGSTMYIILKHVTSVTSKVIVVPKACALTEYFNRQSHV